MSRKKEIYLVIDTETCNIIEQPFVYDVGYALCDREGKILLTRSFIVTEMFLDNKDLMQSAYYANKIPSYWEDIKNGKKELKSIFNIKKQISADIKDYGVKKICAYNCGFDKKALNNTIRYCSQSYFRWFFPFGIEFFDIWNCACELLLARKSYIDFALKNGLISDKDNILTSAEATYKYIKNKIDFEESHTGLEDVRIEVEILAECYRQHKKMNTSINTACWRKVQHKRKEIDLRAVFR